MRLCSVCVKEREGEERVGGKERGIVSAVKETISYIYVLMMPNLCLTPIKVALETRSNFHHSLLREDEISR